MIIIAEIGSSPAPEWAFERWCEAASLAGATHVKAQMFQAAHFPPAEQASKRPLVFPRQRLGEFVSAAHQCGLKAGVSVFDLEAVDLAGQQGDFLKLAAREENEPSLLDRCLDVAKPLFRSVSSSEKWGGWTANGQIVHLRTIPQYPTPLARALVEVVKTARAWHKFSGANSWGWSSHTRGALDCWLAVALGATVIEKHLCLTEHDLEAGHSLNPTQFKAMAQAIKGAR